MLLVAGNKKSTPKKRIFRVPYAVNSTPYIVNLEFLGSQFRILVRLKRILIR